MRLKNGVVLEGVQWQMFYAATVAEEEYQSLGFKECVITSGKDGVHSAGSLHFKGLAIDLRTWYMSQEAIELVARKIRARLGDDYDVVVEADHIHIEYDPK